MSLRKLATQYLVGVFVVQDDEDDGCRAAGGVGPLDQRKGPVLEGTTAVALRVKVGHLLELQRTLANPNTSSTSWFFLAFHVHHERTS